MSTHKIYLFICFFFFFFFFFFCFCFFIIIMYFYFFVFWQRNNEKKIYSQQAHNVETTSIQLSFNVKTLIQRQDFESTLNQRCVSAGFRAM